MAEDEAQHHDFKETIKSLEVEDLTAFANADGGTILLGVSARNGQRVVAGCAWDDKAELQIRQKAAEADPPLNIEIRAENTGTKKPLVRVDIPSSPNKPHGSPRGVFKIRDGNKNRNVRSQELLSIFLDSQESVFVERFKTASSELEGQMYSIEKVTDQLETRVSETYDHLGSIGEVVEEAMARADEGAAEAKEANLALEEIREKLEDVTILLKQIALAAGHDMPDVFRSKRWLSQVAWALARVSPTENDDVLLNRLKEFFPDKGFPENLSAQHISEITTKAFAEGRAQVATTTGTSAQRDGES